MIEIPSVGDHVIYHGAVRRMLGQELVVSRVGCCGVCQDRAEVDGRGPRLVLVRPDRPDAIDWPIRLTHVRMSSVAEVPQ